LVKLGTTQAQRKLFFNLNQEKARLSALGIEPTAAEIAKLKRTKWISSFGRG
jgi:RNA polymerase sigma-32 factor